MYNRRDNRYSEHNYKASGIAKPMKTLQIEIKAVSTVSATLESVRNIHMCVRDIKQLVVAKTTLFLRPTTV